MSIDLNKNMLMTILLHFIACSVLLLSGTASAKTLSLSVIDQEGVPVQNAVIGFRGKTVNSSNQAVIMDQVNKQFLPHVLVAQKGQTVTFPNSDNIRHHIYSFSNPKQFEMRMFKGGERESLLFDQPGIVVLGCNIHDQMVGYIYIADEEQAVLTNERGEAVIDTDQNTLFVWHSRLSANHTERVTFSLPDNSERTHIIDLKLLPKKQIAVKRKFGSRKFLKKDG